MTGTLKYLAYVVGGLVLFVGSFLSFAAVSGTPMHELSLVGRMFPAPEEPEVAAVDAGGPLEQLDQDARSTQEVVEDAAIPLQAFLLPAPFSSNELEGLQRELKASLRANQLRELELEKRERELDLLAQHFDERWSELEALRSSLVEAEMQLREREAELERDADVQAEREKASWTSLAGMFAEGKAKSLALKLMQYAPADAARILRALPAERARELLNEIPVGKHIEYADAYRVAEQ